MSKDNSLYEIFQGVSRLLPETGEVFFYKHPTIVEMEMEMELDEKFTLRAKKNGLKTEQELLIYFKKSGLWTDEEEEKLKQLSWLIDKQTKMLKKYVDEPSIFNELNQTLRETQKDYLSLESKKESLTRFSLEEYVARKINYALFSSFIFKDKKCKTLIEKNDLPKVSQIFMEKYKSLSDRDKTLWRCYNNSFFEMYLIAKNNPMEIFGKNIYEMTIFQKNLLVYSSILRQKIENLSNIPQDVINNPVKLFDYDPNRKVKETETFSIKDIVEKAGGLEKMEAKDKLT